MTDAYETKSVPVRFIKVDAVRAQRVAVHGINDLVASIRSIGLLHPVVVDPDLNLLAGARRLAAVKVLGMKEVMATVVDPGDRENFRLIVTRDENVCRKDFTMRELAALDDQLRPALAAKASQRKGGRPRRDETKAPGASVSEPVRTKEVIAAAAGTSHDTVGRLKRVRDVAAAVKADPDAYTPEQRATVARVHEDVLSERIKVTEGVKQVNAVVPPRPRKDAGVPKTVRSAPGRKSPRPPTHIEKMRNLTSFLRAVTATPVDVAMAMREAHPGEADQWAAAFTQAIPTLRRLHQTIKEMNR